MKRIGERTIVGVRKEEENPFKIYIEKSKIFLL